MGDAIVGLEDRLQGITSALEADGFRLEIRAVGPDRVQAHIVATDAACADCLVPKPVMASIIAEAIGDVAADVELIYPSDAGEPGS